MPSPLKCSECSQSATVHLTQIVNGKMHKIDLCEVCAQAKGVTDPGGFSLADLLLKASANSADSESSAAEKCAECGFAPADFKKHGRFGCPVCYATFSSMVAPMLENMHKGTRHAGKIPAAALERRSFVDRLTALETELAAAIKAERYEDAARVRDELRQLREAQAAADSAATDSTHTLAGRPASPKPRARAVAASAKSRPASS
jgi:protein arginine kinase activator